MINKSVFEDEVIRATELNRASGEVLNRALKSPVTIIRNDEAFALMRREVAASLQRESCFALHLAEITILAMSKPETLAPEYRWIGAFDEKQRLQLTQELIEGYREALRKGEWESFEATLHEWSESGWAAQSLDHREAFDAPAEPVFQPEG